MVPWNRENKHRTSTAGQAPHFLSAKQTWQLLSGKAPGSNWWRLKFSYSSSSKYFRRLFSMRITSLGLGHSTAPTSLVSWGLQILTSYEVWKLSIFSLWLVFNSRKEWHAPSSKVSRSPGTNIQKRPQKMSRAERHSTYDTCYLEYPVH